jgi:hypothetical protein
VRVCQHCGTAADESDRFCAVCGARLPEEGSSGSSDPLIGRTVGGSYTLQEIVGVGGMGRVYRAEQGTLGRTVAIKVIHPHLLGDDQTVARFYQEARAASRLNHPNSVSIIDFGRTEDGILYLAMEHLTGRDLSLVMHEEGPLPFKRVCNILIAVLDALGEAHQLGIVHRDLKPENIILTRTRSGSDLVKVVDFGLATIVGGETSITRPGLVCGTPDYMSPEQGRGDPVDGRGDLYSLGVMLFELLCDQLPFVDDTPTKVVLRHLNDPVPDPRVVVPHRGIPDSLAEIVLRALEKDPDDRFADAVAMQEALRTAMEGLKTAKGSTRCAGCGELNPAGMRFCGACGARLPSQLGPPPATPARSARRSVYPVLLDQRPLVGRAAELARLVETCDRATGRTLWLRIDGEPGVGKSRLVQEAARLLSERGDVVIATGGPHPSGAPVPYHAVTALLATLLGVPRERFRELATEGNGFDALAQAGIDDVLEPKGLEGADNAGRSGAAAAAVAAALVLSMSRNDARRAMIVLDDLQRCDGLTQLCASALPTALEGVSSLLVTIGRERFGDPEPMVLRGLNVEETGLFLAGKTSPTASHVGEHGARLGGRARQAHAAALPRADPRPRRQQERRDAAATPSRRGGSALRPRRRLGATHAPGCRRAGYRVAGQRATGHHGARAPRRRGRAGAGRACWCRTVSWCASRTCSCATWPRRSSPPRRAASCTAPRCACARRRAAPPRCWRSTPTAPARP